MTAQGGRLDNKVVLVSGGARGQGGTEVRLMASEGARVVAGDLLDTEGAKLVEEVEGSVGPDRVAYHHLDVTDEASWAAIVAATVERFGRIDVLVNNAGIFKMLPMAQTSLDDYRQVIDVNQVGVFLGMKAVAPTMVEQRSGSIVNISSIAGMRGSAGAFAYGASKWAVRGMTKSAARELAPMGIRVNSVHPGIIDTPMLQAFHDSGVMDRVTTAIPIGAVAAPDEVARLVLFLASDDSAYCTGAEFIVDGGMTA